MKALTIQRIKSIDQAESISENFNERNISFHYVEQVNWLEHLYKPSVKFRIAHDSQNIYLNWQVDEIEIKAVCEKDFGEVWKDSCVEFFIAFDGPEYYNIECNCIGKALVATGISRNNRTFAPSETIKKIRRWSNLGNLPLEGRSGMWELSLILPRELFYLNSIERFDNLTAYGNFYKCGDALQQPHYLSWNAINSESPNFHLPEYFGKLEFE